MHTGGPKVLAQSAFIIYLILLTVFFYRLQSKDLQSKRKKKFADCDHTFNLKGTILQVKRIFSEMEDGRELFGYTDAPAFKNNPNPTPSGACFWPYAIMHLLNNFINAWSSFQRCMLINMQVLR